MPVDGLDLPLQGGLLVRRAPGRAVYAGRASAPPGGTFDCDLYYVSGWVFIALFIIQL